MEKFFSAFGKTALVLMIIGTIAFSAFYFGKKSNPETKVANSTESNNPPVATPSLSVSISLSPTKTVLKTVNGGVAKKAGLSFSRYSLELPPIWVEIRESQTPNDESLIISNSGHQIKIFQAATGGAMCLYPGDPDFEGPSWRYTNFAELTTKDGTVLRRSGTDAKNQDGKTGYTVCQRNSEGGYGQPTTFGHISYFISQNPDSKLLGEMDAIISSLTKLP